MSDSHDNIRNLNKAIELLQERKVKVLIHCGDLCAPFMLDELKKFNGEVHLVFGNIDDNYLTPKKAYELGINFHGYLGELEIENKKIAFLHNPIFAEALAFHGKYDAVFYGHTHKKKEELVKRCLLVNPGEIMGRLGKPSFAVYDIESEKVEFIEF